MCEKCNILWIGPSPEHMRLMGDKVRAREAMSKAGVPILPGTKPLESAVEVRAAAKKIGLPVILKASAGGGGRGMKIVDSEEKLVNSWEAARTEAQAAFGNSAVYMERYVLNPRHIEVQIIGDSHGTVAHLGERECSIQRRHQKILEEAPSAALDEKTRNKLTSVSVTASKEIGYQSLGTIEYLLDEKGNFYFMEMNTRLQVEHPVTEMVTGLDLVRQQVRVAAGEKLSFSNRKPRGHSIELRVNAEDPETFAPWPGQITALNLPGGLGVRVDTHIYEGYVVPPHYDSLLAKLIIHDDNREAAVRRAHRCLNEFVVEGVRTNLPLHRRILNHPDFVAGRVDTGFLARMLSQDSGA